LAALWPWAGTADREDHAGPLLVSLAASLLIHALLFALPPGTPTGAPPTGKPRLPLAVELARSPTSAEATVPPIAPIPHAPVVVAPQAITAAAVAEAGPSGEPNAARPPSPAEAAPAPAAKPSITGPFGPWYYPARYLHRRVTPLKPIWPAYPDAAAQVAGKVTLLLLINEYGQVDQHRIVDAEPKGVFEEAVIDAFVHQARYAPGMITGYPVRAQLLAEVTFEPGMPPQSAFRPMDPQQGPVMGLPAPAVQPTVPTVPAGR
jgi:protein TonB